MAINYWVLIGVSGLILAVIFAIGQRKMGTIWNNIVSIATNDIFKRIFYPGAPENIRLRFSRVFTVIIALITIIISLTVVDQAINALFIANIFIASLFFPAIGGFLWWGGKQMKRQAG